MRTLKKTAAVLLAALLVLAGGMLLPGANSASAASSGSLQVTPDSATIYDLSDWAKEYISLPAEYPQSVQLSITGVSDYTCRVIQGDSVEVSAAGLVTPRYTTYYWNGNIGTTIPTGQPGERVEVRPNFGSSVVRVQSGNNYVDVTVTFTDYAGVYADQVMEEYLAQHVTADMTVREKLDQICQFVASYDYSPSFSSAAGMIVSGGGDCWSSTNTILAMCDKLGIRAWARNGNQDPGAGSGHMNAMVEGDGTYYEADAGYSGTAPRYYSITQRSSLFSYYTVSGGIELYQYDGYDGMTDVLEIPEEINGRTVVGIGDSFLTMDDSITEVILPDTLTYLGQSAFNSCSALTTLHIPAGVTSIGAFAFTNDNALVNFTCDPANPSYTVEGGVLYDKAKTTVLAVPAAAQVTLPETVTAVGDYAFYWNQNLTQLSLPDSVTRIGEGAFGECSNLTQLRLSENLTEIDPFAFRSCSGLSQLILPESVTSVGANAFQYFRGTLYVWQGSAAENYAQQNGLDYAALTLSGGRYDQNRDGWLDVLDLMALAQSVVNQETDRLEDFNQDGITDVLDVMTLAQLAVS